MEHLNLFIQQLSLMEWKDLLDILVVAFLIYKLIPLFRQSGTMRIARVVVVILVLSAVTTLIGLNTISYVITQFLQIGLIAVVVLFQPELRRMLDQLSNIKLKQFLGTEKPGEEMIPVIAQTVHACEVMSRERIGALIVFARTTRLDEYFKTGTAIDGQVSEQLIRNIFYPKAALHDGAVIIRDGRVVVAGCVLPLSDSDHLSADLGTRHRAAVGMSEASDAVIVVVSEETGAISVAVGGMLKRHLAPQMLERLLRSELCREEEKQEENPVVKLLQKLQKKGKGEV